MQLYQIASLVSARTVGSELWKTRSVCIPGGVCKLHECIEASKGQHYIYSSWKLLLYTLLMFPYTLFPPHN
jgi:hypothetical protein